MKIVINSSTQRFGGSVQVALSFIYECIKFPEHEYHVWAGPGVRKSLVESDFPQNFKFYDFNFGVINLLTTRRIQKTLTNFEKKIEPDVIIATSGPAYFKSKVPQIVGFNLPLYIYPESPYILELPFKQRLILNLKKKLHFYFFKRETAAYVTQTEDVSRRVKKAFGTDKVYTVTNTYSGFYTKNKNYPNKLPPRKDNEIRLLTVSSYYAHKNLEIIPEIVKYFGKRNIKNIRFVVTLKDEDFNNTMGGLPEITNVGPINPEECPSLYQECDIMFLPTLAECFSASYPEAMIMQKPIITTDLGFARSICGGAALYYTPKDAKSAGDAIIKLTNDQALQKSLIKKGLEQLNNFDSATSRASKYLDLCKKIGGNEQEK